MAFFMVVFKLPPAWETKLFPLTSLTCSLQTRTNLLPCLHCPPWTIIKRWESALTWDRHKLQAFYQALCDFGGLRSKHWTAGAGIERLVQAVSRALWWNTPSLQFGKTKRRMQEDAFFTCFVALLCLLVNFISSPPKRCISPEAWDQLITWATGKWAAFPNRNSWFSEEIFFASEFSVSKTTKHWWSLFPYNYSSLTKKNNMRIQ